MIKIPVKIFNKSGNPLPKYGTEFSAGCDVYAFLNVGDPFVTKSASGEFLLVLPPKQRVMVHTGLYMEIPVGYEVQIRPRSGLAYKRGLMVINSPGTIDSDYRGECNVLLYNSSDENIIIENRERIAQYVLKEAPQIEWQQVNSVEELEDSKRSVGGYGHTGTK